MIVEEKPKRSDFSQHPIQNLEKSGVSQTISSEEIKTFRKISSDFFESIAFGFVEHRIMNYDANEFINFIDRMKTEIKTFLSNSSLFLKTLEEPFVKKIFDSTTDFLENLNDMLLNCVASREEILQMIKPTLEELSNYILKGFGLYIRACILNYANSNRDYYSYQYQTDDLEKYLKTNFFEKEITFDEANNDIQMVCNKMRVHICVFFPNGGCCTHHNSKAEHTINILYSQQENLYFLLYADPKKKEISEKIPLPPPSLTDLMDSHYQNETELRPISLNNEERPYKNMNIHENNEVFDMENGCSICHLKIKEKMFLNSTCNHRYCYSCLVEKTQQKHCSSICFEARCIQSLNLREMEDYLVEMNMFKELELNENFIEKIPFFCTNCQNEELVSVSPYMVIENFVCNQCKDLQCLLHSSSNKICQCFCEGCKERLEEIPALYIRNCKVCQKEYCTICSQEKRTCKCFCEVCVSRKTYNMDESFCTNCMTECMNCHIKYDQNLLTFADCKKHKVCRNCYIQALNNELFNKNITKCQFCSYNNNNSQ